MNDVVQNINWTEISVDNLILPEELICFYLYKYRNDLAKKKDNKAELDLSYIKAIYEKWEDGNEDE